MVSNIDDPSDVWPLPKFYFLIESDSLGEIAFQEVSGLDTEEDVIAYRHNDNDQFSSVRMSGIAKSSTVTLKKGVFANDNAFWGWFEQIKMNEIKRETVTIKLLDETGAPAMVWTLSNAWPTKVTGTDLKAEGNEVAVETLELAYEGLAIENA